MRCSGLSDPPPTDNGGSKITGYDLLYIRSDAPNKADANWIVEQDIWISVTVPHAVWNFEWSLKG